MYNLIQYASGPIKIYNLPIHLYYTILTDFERKERCVDDTIHYDTDLREHWWRTIDFLILTGRSGIVLNPDKFCFAQRTVDFAGFCISDSSIEPLPY